MSFNPFTAAENPGSFPQGHHTDDSGSNQQRFGNPIWTDIPNYLRQRGIHAMNPLVMILTPGGRWELPRHELVDVSGPSFAATMDLGHESFPQVHVAVQEQPGVRVDGAQGLERQLEEQLRNLLISHRSSQKNCRYLSPIIEEPDESMIQVVVTDGREETRKEEDLGVSEGPAEDFIPVQNSKAGPSSQVRESQPNVDGTHKELEQMDVVKADDVDQKSTATGKRKRSAKKKPKCCRLCEKNGKEPEVYQSHNTVDRKGVTTCPFLREHVCLLCKQTGDKAHTLRYCPVNIRKRYQYLRQQRRIEANRSANQ